MKKQSLIVVTATLLVLAALMGCNAETPAPDKPSVASLEGTWEQEGTPANTYTFTDKNFTKTAGKNTESGTYSTEENKLVFETTEEIKDKKPTSFTIGQDAKTQEYTITFDDPNKTEEQTTLIAKDNSYHGKDLKNTKWGTPYDYDVLTFSENNTVTRKTMYDGTLENLIDEYTGTYDGTQSQFTFTNLKTTEKLGYTLSDNKLTIDGTNYTKKVDK